MTKLKKKLSVKGINEAKELAEIDALFKRLDNDKSLPTFGQHFMHCLMFNIGHNVDLEKLYPKTYKRLSMWLARHNRKILTARKG